ncbi:nuclear pore complex protein NUP1-like [Ziziphus jujuba]|uniref:Nuclear pore complex protein NUP1-like n=1 Tax=Ziziphus jujuba TaxID=326968 RepID=A0ABM4AGB7_ZIZJJ|nr:nuclear pore complex protein NUP1-like [Ziziphus jujuba]
MAIIISIGAKISEYTVEPIGRQLGYLLNYKSNVENLRTQIQHLKDERDKLQHSIDEAKKNSEEEIEADVANWLSRIDRMISQHSEKFLTNEGRANINCLSGKLLDLGSRHRMSRKAKKMAMEAAIEILAAGEFHKDVGPAVSPYGGPSSSQSAREQSLFTSSKEGALQCQSSVLDNDIGSSGPSVSGSLSIPKTGLGSVAAQTPSSSIQKLNSSGELKNDYEEASTENEESTMSSTSFSSVPTKSSGMDSKMLQQLDKLVLPKDELSEPNLLTSMDKSLTNMSPSVPHGQALKSLEAVDSSNYLGDEQDKKKLDASLDKKVPDARDTTSLEQDTVEESGRLKIVASCDKATDVVNDVDSAVPKKITSMNIETTVYSNGAVSHSSADGTQKVDTFSAERKSHNTEAVILEKPPLAFLECKPSTSAVNNKPDPETSDGSVSAEKNSNFVNADASSPSMAILRPEVATQSPLTSDAASPPMVSNVALSIFNFGDKVASTKDSDAASPTCSFGSKPEGSILT